MGQDVVNAVLHIWRPPADMYSCFSTTFSKRSPHFFTKHKSQASSSQDDGQRMRERERVTAVNFQCFFFTSNNVASTEKSEKKPKKSLIHKFLLFVLLYNEKRHAYKPLTCTMLISVLKPGITWIPLHEQYILKWCPSPWDTMRHTQFLIPTWNHHVIYSVTPLLSISP